MLNFNKKSLLAYFLISIVLLSVAPLAYWTYVSPELEITQINIKHSFIKGETLEITIDFKVRSLSITISNVTLIFEKYPEALIFQYKTQINQRFSIGKHTLKISIPPIIEDEITNKVVPFDYGVYVLNKLVIDWVSAKNSALVISKNPYSEFYVNKALPVNRIIHWDLRKPDSINHWKILSNASIKMRVIEDGGVLLKNEGTTAAYFSIKQKINLTGVPKIDVIFQGQNPNITAFFNNTKLVKINEKDYEVSFLSADKTGVSNLTITIKLAPKEQILLQAITAITNHISIFVAVLEHYWNNGTGFDPLVEDIQEASKRFLAALNVSFIPGPPKFFTHDNTSNLFTIRDQALQQIKEIYGLSRDWKTTTPYKSMNDGFDLLFIATHHYTDHYGIVFSKGDEPSNILIVSDQSKEAFGIKLKPEWVDNLFQHELSHVLWALDHWSQNDPPSVMTKPSSVRDAIAMYMAHQLWLQVTNWLVEDLVRMMNYKERFW